MMRKLGREFSPLDQSPVLRYLIQRFGDWLKICNPVKFVAFIFIEGIGSRVCSFLSNYHIGLGISPVFLAI